MCTFAQYLVSWTTGVKAVVGLGVTLTMLFLINLFVYQTGEKVLCLIFLDLLASVCLSGLVLVQNQQRARQDRAERAAKQSLDLQVAELSERVAELSNLNRTLQADSIAWQRLEKQLKSFQKMEALGKLVNGVSHEFNNALTVIIGFSEQMLMQLTSGTTDHTTITEVYRAGERAAELTRGLLNLVRPVERGRRPVDINRQVEGIRRILQVVVGKRVRLDFTLQNDLPMIEASPGQIEQVLLNLTTNARDAMVEGGQLTVEARAIALPAPNEGVAPGRYVLLSVADTGTGMTAEIRQHMFEPFFTTKEQNTGLGLTAVSEIVAGAGGFVLADSTPGKGTTFKVYWPVVSADALVGARNADRETIRHAALGEHDTWPGYRP